MTKESVEEMRRVGGYVLIPAEMGRELADAQDALAACEKDSGRGSFVASLRLSAVAKAVCDLVGEGFRS